MTEKKQKTKNKKSIRDSLLASSTSKKPIVEVKIDGEVFFLKTPKVYQRSKILAGVQNCETEDEKISFSQIQSLIAFAVDSDGENLFSYADIDTIKEMDAGSTIDSLGIEALSLLNVESMIKSDEKKA